MARFGQGLIQALTNPSYQQGMFNLGSAIGSAPAVRRDQQAKSTAMTMVNEALASQDPNKIQSAAVALQKAGMNAEAMELSKAAGQLRAKAEESRLGRGLQGGLTAITEAARRGIPLEDLGEAKKSIIGLNGTNEQIIDAYNAGLKERDLDVTSSRSAGQYSDEKGNLYEATIQRTSQGEKLVYIPISPNAPKTPTSKLTAVGGQFRETAAAATGRKVTETGASETAKQFGDLKVRAAEELPTLLSQKNDINAAMASLDNISTAGIPAQVENYLRRATGGQEPDVANYELLVGEAMYSRLKPLFGGVISEGERKAIEGLYNNLKRGNPANKSILQQMKRKLDESIEKANLIRSSENFDEYNQKLDKFFPEGSESENAQKDSVVGEYNPETGFTYYGPNS